MKKQQRLLKKYYQRRMQTAKQQLRQFEQGKRSFEQLNSRARKLLRKRVKAGYKFQPSLFSKQST
ncbi:MAG TPA: hypothetical protein P5065_07135 [Candidatus Ratteibacteria bacterium]|jgi:hypothetical protein|uniref:Uncharacterized protein n=1 Tax=candidate division TA06 bacterium ADurb.Bin131 TaxID=1852827 RepID=A0A1V6C8I8_UNCT6|nr:MAG: hypothetical protein BWX89_01081 [candidate division TA06 bacterium ADurb.Bin131]HON06194.1 hypothetical protein [bacterium]HPC29876.1 hypothetical protein [bacterium]HRS06795.1 hypothetical protein [Candidatus Ratteibacteria bacterium]HRV04785.1 hypothetical protein [Candidatus Ratteibacteria bacterium]